MVKAITSAYVGLAVLAALVQNVAAHQPHLNVFNHRDLAAHHHALEKKDFGVLVGRQISIGLPGQGDTDTITNGPTGPGGSGGTGGPGNTGGSGGTTSPTTTTPTTTEPTTTSPTTTDPPTSTTSTSSTSTTSTPSTSSTPGSTTSTPPATTNRANTGSTFVNTARVTSVLRASTTSTGEDVPAPTSSDTPFLKNKTAVAATFTVVAVVAFGIIVFIIIWLKKKQQRGKIAEEDMWDEAGMTEFTRPPPDVTPPSPALIAGGGLGRKNTVLPSQSAGAARHARSSPDPYGEEPDEILAVPPVVNYERPRDSAFDIVPAVPPPAAVYGGGSGGMQPPRRGDHTSFGSGLGVDPFAGTGFVDATRESAFGGPGQAGRGAGYNMAPYEPQHPGAVQMGNQWPQGYNPYNGYSQGNEEAYGGAYGGHAYGH